MVESSMKGKHGKGLAAAKSGVGHAEGYHATKQAARRRLIALTVSFVLVAQAMLSPLLSVVAYAESEGVAWGGFSSGDGADEARFSADANELRIAVLSDTHYYPVNFVSDCADYETYVGGDPKMLEESGSILDAALDMVRQDAPDILIVSGDLTKDGEIQGHRDLAAKFQDLENETDTEVFVINGNHDIYNYEDACTFQNGYQESAQTTTPDEFKQIYANFGYNGDFDAQYFTNLVAGEEAGGLSYAVDLGQFTIVAVDSGMYSPDAGTGYDTNEHVTSGRVDEDLLPWVTDRVREADAEGDTVIGIMHHGLIPHFEGEEDILSEYVVEDWQNVATQFADAGMRYIFTGHMHANDIAEYTTVSGNHITDLETGSLSSWKSPMRTVTLTKGEALNDGTARTQETFAVSSRGVTSIDFTDHTGQTTHIDDFLAYTQQTLYPETLFNNMANGMLRPMLQEIGGTGLRQWIAENLPDLDLDGTILDLVRDALAGGMEIELGTGIGRVHVEYRNGGIHLSPSGTAGLIGSMTITDAQLLQIVYDVIDKVEARYIDNPDWLLGQIDDIVTQVSSYGLTSLDSEQKTIYDLVFVILTGHYGGAENPPAWVADAVATIRQGDIIQGLITMLVDDLMPIVDDVLSNTSIDTGIAFSGLWKTAIDSMTNDGNLKETLETFGFDQAAIRGLVDGLINEYMSPSFLTGMGSLVGNICDSMLYDTNGADDVIGGDGRTITFDGVTEAPAPSVENGLLPTQVTMTLGADGVTSRNIRWYTGTMVTEGTVQVATDAGFEDIVTEVDATSEEVTKPQTQLNLGLVTTYGTQQATKHSATVSGLAENTDYYYRVGDKDNGYWSDAIPFTTGGETDDSDTFSFINVNDSQGMVESDYDVYLNTLEQARASFPDAAFTIHGGDFVDDGANEDYWTWALDDENDVAQGMAMAPAAGNHEARSEVGGITDENPIVSHFNLANVPEGQDLSTGVYYSFEYKNATFVVLNTNDLSADGGISQTQYDWAYQALSAADTEWKIVLLHKSPYSNGPHQTDEDVVAIRGQMDALAASCDVDVVLSGHDHVYNRTPYLMRGEAQAVTTETQTYQGTNYETAVNPNGTVFIIAGTCGVKNYAQDTTGGIPSQVALDLSVPVFTGFTIDGDHLYYQAYTVSDGASTMVDSFAISKAEDATPAWQEVEDQIAALPEQSEVTLDDQTAIEAARAAYNGLSPEEQQQVSNVDRLVAAERMLELLQSVDGKRTVTVTNHDQFTAAINDPNVGTIITQGTIEFDEGGWFDDGDREIYVRRDVVVRGTGELRFCRFHVENGATLVLADSVYVNDTRTQGSPYDALNPVEVNAGGTLITQDTVSLRTEYGQGGSDEGVAVKLMGAGATAILGSSGTYWGSEAAVLSTAEGTTLVINDGTFNAKNNNRVVIDTHGDATVNGGTISSMWISGTLRVNGGTFEHQDSASSDWTPLAVSGGNAYITGGTFETYGGRDGTASIKLENGARLHVLADTNGAVRIGSMSAYVGSPSTTDYENVRLGYVRANGWNGSQDGIYRVEGAASASSVEEVAALGGTHLTTNDVSDNGNYMTTTLPDGTSTVYGKYWLYGGTGGKSAPSGSGIIGSGEVIVYGPVRTIQNNPVTGVTIDGDATRLVDLAQEGADTLLLTGYTTPANAFNNGITWSSDNEQTASVEERNGQGVVTIKQAGGANITATSDANQSAFASVEVIAVRPELEGPETLDEETETASYTASKGFESAAYDERLAWRYSVSDQTIATIDAETGVLTKAAPGSVTVTATLYLDGEPTMITVSKDVVLKAAPEIPDVDAVNALIDVRVTDANEDMAGAHTAQTFEGLIANTEGLNDSYTIGEVYSENVAADNPFEAFTNFVGITRAAKVYKVDVIIQAAPYVAAFDEALDLEAGTHEVSGDESRTVTLVWSDGDPAAGPAVAAGWTLEDPAATPVTFQGICKSAQAALELTVTPGADHAMVTVAGANGAGLYGDIQWSDDETAWESLRPGPNTHDVSTAGTFYFRAAGDGTHEPSAVATVTIAKVTFDAGDGEFEGGGTTSAWYLQSGTAIGADNLPTAARDDYVFAGWQAADGTTFDGATTVEGEVTVTAQWGTDSEPVIPSAPTPEGVAEMLSDQLTVELHGKNDLHHGDGADAHPDVTFGAGSENALIAEGFTVSSPVKQETEGGGEAWTMEVALDGQAYLNAYAQMANADGEPYGTHYFASADETGMRSFTLMLDTTADEPAWTLDASSEADITFDITCLTLQPAELDMYTGGTGSDHFPDAHVVDGMGNVYTIDELNELLDEGVTAAVKYYDAEGNEITDDEEPGEYTARIVVDGTSGTRSGDDSTLNVNVGDADYEYALETSTLTIRNVSNVADAEAGETNVQLLESGATTEQIQAALATDDVVAQLPADTRILVNGREGGELTGDELDGVTLFSDELLGAAESGGLDRLQALVQKAIDAGYVFDSEDADFRYLDLVDAAQSNIWVSSTAGTTIYWKVPEDVDAENLRVLHFEGLHREYGVDAADLESQIAACSVESMELDTTHIADGYVSFTVDAAGFSPFALVTINPEPDAATVTFDAQGGTFADEAQVTREVTVGAMLGELPAVTRDGWTLAGWYTEPQGGEEVTADTVVEDGGAVTYYAHWTIDQATTMVTLTLDAGDGAAFEGGSQTTSVVVPSGKPVHSSDLPTPTRDGFALEGWYLDEGFSQKVVFSDEADTGAQATTFNAVTTLYAKLIGDLSDQITIPGIDEPVRETYNGGEHPVAPEYDGAFPEDERANVIVEYRTAGSTGDDGWSTAAPVDAGSYDVRVTYPGSDDYAPFVLEGDGVLVIEKAALAQTGLAASPAEVEAGTALASIQLAGGTVTMADGTPVSGSWSWANPNATVDASGVYQAVFTPDDADNFETLTVDVQLTVADSGGEPDGGDTDPDTPVTPDDPDGGSDQPFGNGGDDAGQSGGGSTSADAPTDGTLSSTGDATVLAVAATGALGAIAVAGGLLARRKKHEE